MQPDLIEEFIREFDAEMNNAHRDLDQRHEFKRRNHDAMVRRLDGLYEAIADGLRTPGLRAKLEEIEDRKSALETEIATTLPPTPRLHPNLAQFYRYKVDKLHASPNAPDTRTEAADIVRTLIKNIKVLPLPDGFEIEPIGETASIVILANTSDQ